MASLSTAEEEPSRLVVEQVVFEGAQRDAGLSTGDGGFDLSKLALLFF